MIETFKGVDASFSRLRITPNGGIWVNPSEEFELVYETTSDSFIYLGQPIVLSSTSKRLLKILLAHAPRVVSKQNQCLQLGENVHASLSHRERDRLYDKHTVLHKALLKINPDFSGIENVPKIGNAWIDPLPLGFERKRHLGDKSGR